MDPSMISLLLAELPSGKAQLTVPHPWLSYTALYLFLLGCFLGVSSIVLIDCQRCNRRSTARLQAPKLSPPTCPARMYQRLVIVADSVLDHIDSALVRLGLLPDETQDASVRTPVNGSTLKAKSGGEVGHENEEEEEGTRGNGGGARATSADLVIPAFSIPPSLTTDRLPDVVLRFLSQRTLTARMEAAMRQPCLLTRLQEATARAQAVRNAAALFAVGMLDWTWDIGDGAAGSVDGEVEEGEEEGEDGEEGASAGAPHSRADPRPIIAFCFYLQLCSPFVALDMPGSQAGGLMGEGTPAPAATSAPTPSPALAPPPPDSVESRCTAASLLSPVFPVRLGQDPLAVAWGHMAQEEEGRCGIRPATPFTVAHAHLAFAHGSIATKRSSAAATAAGAGGKGGGSQPAPPDIDEEEASYQPTMRHSPYIVPFTLAGAGGIQVESSLAATGGTGGGRGGGGASSEKEPFALSSRAYLVAELDGAHDRCVLVVHAGVTSLASELVEEENPGMPLTSQAAEEEAEEGEVDPDAQATAALCAIASLSGPMPLLHVGLECTMLGACTSPTVSTVAGPPASVPLLPSAESLATALLSALDACFLAAARADGPAEVATLSHALQLCAEAGRSGWLPWQARREAAGAEEEEGEGLTVVPDSGNALVMKRRLSVPVAGGSGEGGAGKGGGSSSRTKHSPGSVALESEGEGGDMAVSGLELVTHPATLHVLRAAAHARLNAWGAVVQDCHAALAWEAGCFHPGMHGAGVVPGVGLGEAAGGGPEAALLHAVSQAGAGGLATAWRFTLPPRLRREAYTLLGWAWQALAAPQAALQCFDTAFTLGATEGGCFGVGIGGLGQGAGQGQGAGTQGQERKSGSSTNNKNTGGSDPAIDTVSVDAALDALVQDARRPTLKVGDTSLGKLLAALLSHTPPASPEHLWVSLPGTTTARTASESQRSTLLECRAIHRLASIACPALISTTALAMLHASALAMGSRLGLAPSVTATGQIVNTKPKAKRAALCLLGPSPSAALTWLPPQASAPSSSRGAQGGVAGRGAHPSATTHLPRLGAVYWHTATYVPPVGGGTGDGAAKGGGAAGSGAGKGAGRIFVFGGCGGAGLGPTAELAVCDVASRAWVPLTALPTQPPGPLYLHQAVLLPVPKELLDCPPAARPVPNPGRQILFLGGATPTTTTPASSATGGNTLAQPWTFDATALQWGSVPTRGSGGGASSAGLQWPQARAAHCAVVCPPPAAAAAPPVDEAAAPSRWAGCGRAYMYGGLCLEKTGGSLSGPWGPGTVLGDLWSLGWEKGEGAWELTWRLECGQDTPVAHPAFCPPPPRYGATLTAYDPSAWGALGSALPAADSTPSTSGTSSTSSSSSGVGVHPLSTDLITSQAPKLVLIGGRDTPVGCSDPPPTPAVLQAASSACASVEEGVGWARGGCGDWAQEPTRTAFPGLAEEAGGAAQRDVQASASAAHDGQSAGSSGAGSPPFPTRGLPPQSVPDMAEVSVWDTGSQQWLHPLVLGQPPKGALWHSTVPVKHWLFVLGGQASEWSWVAGGHRAARAQAEIPQAKVTAAKQAAAAAAAAQESGTTGAAGAPMGAGGCLGEGYGHMVTAAVASSALAPALKHAATAALPSAAPGLLPLPAAFPRLGLYILDLHCLHWSEPYLAVPRPPGQAEGRGGMIQAHVLPPFRYGLTALAVPAPQAAASKAAGGSSGGSGGKERLLVFGGAYPGLCVREDSSQAWAAALLGQALQQRGGGDAARDSGKRSALGPTSLFLSTPGLVQEVDIGEMVLGVGSSGTGGEAALQPCTVIMRAVAMPVPSMSAPSPGPAATGGGGAEGQRGTGKGAMGGGAGYGQGVGGAPQSRQQQLQELLFGGSQPAARGSQQGAAALPARAASRTLPGPLAKGGLPSSSSPAHAQQPADLSWVEEWDKQQAAEKAAQAARDAEARERNRAKAARKQEREQAKAREARERQEKEREQARGKAGTAAGKGDEKEPAPSVPPSPSLQGTWVTAGGRARVNTGTSTGVCSTGAGAGGAGGALEGGGGSRDGGGRAGGRGSSVGASSTRSTSESPPVTSSPADPSAWPKLQGKAGSAAPVPSKHTLASKLDATPPTKAKGGKAAVGGKAGQGQPSLVGTTQTLPSASSTALAGAAPATGGPAHASSARRPLAAPSHHPSDVTWGAASTAFTALPASAQLDAMLQAAAAPSFSLEGEGVAAEDGEEVEDGAGEGVDEIDRLLRQALDLAPLSSDMASHGGGGPAHGLLSELEGGPHPLSAGQGQESEGDAVYRLAGGTGEGGGALDWTLPLGPPPAGHAQAVPGSGDFDLSRLLLGTSAPPGVEFGQGAPHGQQQQQQHSFLPFAPGLGQGAWASGPLGALPSSLGAAPLSTSSAQSGGVVGGLDSAAPEFVPSMPGPGGTSGKEQGAGGTAAGPLNLQLAGLSDLLGGLTAAGGGGFSFDASSSAQALAAALGSMAGSTAGGPTSGRGTGGRQAAGAYQGHARPGLTGAAASSAPASVDMPAGGPLGSLGHGLNLTLESLLQGLALGQGAAHAAGGGTGAGSHAQGSEHRKHASKGRHRNGW